MWKDWFFKDWFFCLPLPPLKLRIISVTIVVALIDIAVIDDVWSIIIILAISTRITAIIERPILSHLSLRVILRLTTSNPCVLGRLRTLCTEFILSNDLPKDPADILPFNLIVDNPKWKVSKNGAPLRTQSAVKQTELFKTLQTLISQGIVEKSQSPHYSQILMVPQPDGAFRMRVDYRALNDCATDASRPVPDTYKRC